MSFVSPENIVERLGIHPGMTVADFGAGAGAYAVSAGRLVGKKGVVYAIDIQKELISRVKNEAKKAGLENVEVIWGDLEEEGGSKLDSDIADVVIASNILFQIKDKDAFLREILRVLKPGGKVCVVDWSESFGGVGPPEELVVSESAAKSLFEENGFLIDRSLSPGAHHYGFIAKRRKQ